MTPRQRILAALDHRESDRIPIDLGSSIVTSITRAAYAPLRQHLGLPEEEIVIHDEVQQLPYVGEDVLTRFGVDTRMVQLPPAHVAGVEIVDDGDYWAMWDRWGSKMRMPKVNGLYYDWVAYPITELTLEALDAYRWPQPDPPEVVATLRARAAWLRANTDFALVGSGVIGGGIFEQPCRTVGLETFMMALLSEQRFAERLMDRITDIYIESVDRYLGQVGDLIDVFTFWDDVATQSGWMINPQTYVDVIKPRQKRLFEAIKARTSAKLFYHGCGAVFELIPHLIEIGVDIINPVQVSAAGMDPKRLKAAYGKDIVFWGGGVDTQRVLPFGTPEEVGDEVRRRIDDFAPGGGFVFATVHNIQAFVPPANIVAAFDTAAGIRADAASIAAT
ncbi:MAG TPA: uroporphyrinogen decarboxylase family protein [Candidatus Limnocylindrales bacterium]|nr:uroporphyrinogen decarboxylase family protein [Candidatus Limnocylindrales bacterium]